MGSNVITFRVPEEVYEEFKRKCSNDGVKPADRLREFVDKVCYPSQAEDEVASKDSAKPNNILQSELKDVISRIEDIEQKRSQMYEAFTKLVKDLESFQTGLKGTEPVSQLRKG